MRRPPLSSLCFAEKEFYLDEFHEKSLLFALRAADWASETDMQAALEVFETLLRNETRVLLLLQTGNGGIEQRRVMALHKQLARVVKTPHASAVVFSGEESVDQLCMQMWEVLRDTRLFTGLWPPGAPVPLACCAQRIAVGLRVYKLVYIDPLGGLAHDGKILSFLNGPGLQDLLRPGRAEAAAGLGARRPLLEAILGALAGGVTSVSLCPLAGVGRELFTYEGCGTLFTHGEYCQVEKLGIDDFHEVEKLLQRAQQAGYLKPRTPQEMVRLLLHGYGARLGPATMEPAGFCALLPYPEDRAAEIVGLFTITRYQGEGVGSRLVDAMVHEGERQGLAYVFACTTQEGAQRLFARQGFQRVPPEAVAAAKWYGYDPERRQQVAVYRRDLTPCEQEGNVHNPLT
jgi:N-acetylglutamate synthase-like GNAT family acetyltransferase